MREGHVAHAELVISAQHRERVVDLMAALDADQAGDPTTLVHAHDVAARIGHREVVWVAAADLFDQVDLLDGHLHCGRSLGVGRYPYRPELCADVAGTQTRDVSHQRRITLRRGQPRGGVAEV